MPFEMGHIGWNKGGTRTEATKKKISKSRKERFKRLGYLNSPETRKKMGAALRGRKHSEETKKKMSESHKKRLQDKTNHSFYGKTLSKTYRENLSKSLMGHPAAPKSLEGRKRISEANIGRYFSLETRKKMSEAHKGKKSYSWKGGLTALQEHIRNSFEYRQWRSDVFTRDDFTCQKCGKRGGDLHVHHIKPFALIVELNDVKTFEQALRCSELWNTNNGMTLCRKCHQDTEGKFV